MSAWAPEAFGKPPCSCPPARYLHRFNPERPWTTAGGQDPGCAVHGRPSLYPITESHEAELRRVLEDGPATFEYLCWFLHERRRVDIRRTLQRLRARGEVERVVMARVYPHRPAHRARIAARKVSVFGLAVTRAVTSANVRARFGITIAEDADA